MTRVSSFGHQQSLLTSLLSRQQSVFNTQEQITTGKEKNSYGEFATEANTLLGAKNLLVRTENYISASETVDRQLRTNDVQLNAIIDNAENVRENVLGAIAQDSSFALIQILGEAFTSTVSALNTNIGGVHVFSGARTDVPPVTGDTLADLQAAAAAGDLFQNDQRRPSARVGQNTISEYGLLADEIAEDLFTAYKNLADFDAGPSGPLNGALTPVQRTFLEGELANLDAAIEDARILLARNGTRQANLDKTIRQHEEQEAFLEVFISDLEDVNIAEAVTRLNNDQVALQASYEITSTLSQLSLLNFL